jgi:ubiquinone/menaquinone biosynthesis C-methylase UbiE
MSSNLYKMPGSSAVRGIQDLGGDAPGMQEGWHVIDCGCGPIGVLALMAELVGPAGRVVGVDFSEPAIQRARSVVAAWQLGNVELFAGDIHELGAARWADRSTWLIRGFS